MDKLNVIKQLTNPKLEEICYSDLDRAGAMVAAFECGLSERRIMFVSPLYDTEVTKKLAYFGIEKIYDSNLDRAEAIIESFNCGIDVAKDLLEIQAANGAHEVTKTVLEIHAEKGEHENG